MSYEQPPLATALHYPGHEHTLTNLEPADSMQPSLARCSLIDPLRNQLCSRTE